jgi:hypothetical protein
MPVNVSVTDSRKIRELSEQLQKSGESALNLKSLIGQILDLDALPHKSPLLFLGYFAVLEALLTHKVKDTDTIDSITRQVKQKVILLNNRWFPPIDYGPFHGAKPERIWSTMYAYRSCLAHGGSPDFMNDLKQLGNREQALTLLKETVKERYTPSHD